MEEITKLRYIIIEAELLYIEHNYHKIENKDDFLTLIKDNEKLINQYYNFFHLMCNTHSDNNIKSKINNLNRIDFVFKFRYP